MFAVNGRLLSLRLWARQLSLFSKGKSRREKLGRDEPLGKVTVSDPVDIVLGVFVEPNRLKVQNQQADT